MALDKNTVEIDVFNILQAAPYAKLYKKAFGIDIMTMDASVDALVVYDNIALAISAFEQSTELNKFSARYDKFRNEQGIATVLSISDMGAGMPTPIESTVYTQEEIEGLALFNGMAKCSLCHTLDDLPDGKTATVFTDFSFDNLGVPINEDIAVLIDPELATPRPIDLGLGARSAEMQEAFEIAVGEGQWDPEMAALQNGKFKVSSLRNIAQTAPYGHNGFFPTLYDIVHFYNTRDLNTDGTPFVDPDGNPIGDVKDHLWPQPEVPATVNHAELGDLGLTFKEEQKIVVFLETLTDQ